MTERLNSLMEIQNSWEKLPKDDRYSLHIGDYNFRPTQWPEFKEWQSERDEGEDRYSPRLGLDKLRKKLAEEYGVKMENVAVPLGTMGAYALWLEIFAKKGKGVIAPNPGWHGYGEAIINRPILGAAIKGVDYSDFNNILKAVSNKTRGVAINSPENPTGKIYSLQERRELIEELYDRDIPVFSDEVYSEIIFVDEEHRSCAELIKDYPNVVVGSSFSKNYALTNYRTGIFIADEKIIEEVRRNIRGIHTSTPAVNQEVALWCLERKERIIPWIKGILQKRIDLLHGYLQEIDENVNKPPATNYFWWNINKDDMLITEKLVKEKHIRPFPGSRCGSNGKGYLRLAVSCIDEKGMKIAGERMIDFFKKFSK